MAIARKTSPPHKPILIEAKADEIRTHLDFDRYDALARKISSQSNSATPPKPIGKSPSRSNRCARHKLDELPARGYRLEEIASAEAHYHQALANWKNWSAAIAAKTWT